VNSVGAGPRLTRHLLVAALVLPALSVRPATAAEDVSDIRIRDRVLRSLVDVGTERSETFRGLVSAVEAAPLRVYVECDPQMPHSLSARLGFVSTVGSIRFVRVELSCTLPSRTQVSLLAHEFQHALEIGLTPDITDADSMEAHYEDVGFQTYRHGTHKGFETTAALSAGQRVSEELDRWRPPAEAQPED